VVGGPISRSRSDSRLGMTLDHEAQVEDEGEVLDAVIYSIADGSWQDQADSAAGRGSHDR